MHIKAILFIKMHEIPCHIDEPVKKDRHSLVTTHHSFSLLMVLLNQTTE